MGFAFKMSELPPHMQVVSSQRRFLESLVYVFVLFEELSTAGSVVKIYHIWKDSNALWNTTLYRLPNGDHKDDDEDSL